jgi:hypothetical protein
MNTVKKIAKIICMMLFGFCLLSSFAANGLAWLRETYSYQRMLRNSFGSAETQRRMMDLYKLLESDSIDNELDAWDHDGIDLYGHPRTRNIATERITHLFDHPGETYVGHYSGIACYNDSGRFEALFINSSRLGCYVSRDPARCPPMFDKLIRYAEADICITGIDKSGEQ